MRNCFYFFADAGHGWLRVTDDDIAAVGLHRGQFSRYSYSDGPRLYLEEDMDASLFLSAYEATTGRAPEIVEHVDHGESLIRTFPRLIGDAYTFEDACRLISQYRAQITAAA